MVVERRVRRRRRRRRRRREAHVLNRAFRVSCFPPLTFELSFDFGCGRQGHGADLELTEKRRWNFPGFASCQHGDSM